jgi:DNA ligase D-like protein (predicted 3'-phosphoesterase)
MNKRPDRLSEYRKKRDLRKSGEPSGKGARPGEEPIFVVQKHDARRLHYDFRLEVDGVLRSWAVPKGPSTDPRERRLAIPTEDHPLDYADFEGVIPEGEYGAGTTLVWDRGTYRNLTEDPEGEDEKPKGMEESLEDGHATFRLRGKKLKGGYSLVRTGKGKDAKWLLVKVDDDEADARRNPVSTQPESVLSGRSIEEIAQEEGDGEGKDD